MSQPTFPEELVHFAERANREYQRMIGYFSVSRKVFPILFFGDYFAYKVPDKRRIMTVGHNPSINEFRRYKDASLEYFRFTEPPSFVDRWRKGEFNVEEYLRSLCNYFKQGSEGKRPNRWFDDNFGELLGHLNGS